MNFLIEAINFFTPNAVVSLSETKIVEWHDSRPQPTEAEIQAKIAELEAAEPLRLLRIERNRLLQETDWRFRSDLTPSQAWYEYCQALRDLPANSEPQLDEFGNLTNVNWPTPPEN
jgi:hypothetical protein